MNRERHRDAGVGRAGEMLGELGRELRMARLNAGLRQADVARAAGVSRSWVSQLELGKVDEVGFRLLTVVLMVVGLEMRVRAYPGPDPLRNTPQRQVLERLTRVPRRVRRCGQRSGSHRLAIDAPGTPWPASGACAWDRDRDPG